jgi:preprotein translocase subunit SecD
VAAQPTPRPGRLLAIIVLAVIALYAWMFISGNTTPKLGLDLRGGTMVTLTPKPAPGQHVTSDSVNEAVNIIQNRVNAYGVGDSTVSTQGSGSGTSIVVQVPGKNSIPASVFQTAKLNFRPVLLTGAPTATVTTKPKTPPSTQATITTPNGNYSPAEQAEFEALDCTAKTWTPPPNPSDKQNLVTCSQDRSTKYILGPVLVSGSDLTGASAEYAASTGQLPAWQVNLSLNGNGTTAFAAATTKMAAQTGGTVGNQFAIVLDNQVVEAPGVTGAIPNGQAQITGNFDQQSANDLANVLKYGSLPLAFSQSDLQSITPTVGTQYLHLGLIAGLLGLLLVGLYCLLYYRGLGLVAIGSLVIAGMLTYGLLCLLGQTIGYTLSLAGVAGAIIAIGITADSFVVFFERIRDEMRDGRTYRVAVETGWKRARRTILAADTVSIIAAVVLYLISVGNVQGFAFTLGLTTLIDIFVVFLFTKPLLTILGRTSFFATGSRWSGVDPDRLGRASTGQPSGPAGRGPRPQEA